MKSKSNSSEKKIKSLVSSAKKSANKAKAKIKKTLNALLKKLPQSKKAAHVAGLILLIALVALVVGLVKGSHPSSFTVMITNGTGNSGGSGSIIETSPSESKILTNAHVCEGALRQGGKVRTVNGEEHNVTGYYLSDEHDLCLVTVAADLKHSVSIAGSAPNLYEEATITGHPGLMPNIINKGEFGGRMIINIMTGLRRCTEKDLENPEKRFYCLMFGGLPVIKTYEAMSVSATIMPGSSGSAILNSNNELSGVVFAGNSRGLSYALAVPYEAVRNFLSREMKTKQKLRPWEDESLNVSEESVSSGLLETIDKVCRDPEHKEKVSKICSKINNSIKIRGVK